MICLVRKRRVGAPTKNREREPGRGPKPTQQHRDVTATVTATRVIMSTIRAMRTTDLLRITTTNLDPFTETYAISFYLEYLTRWPDLCRVIEGVDGEIEGYSACHPSSLPSSSLRFFFFP